MSTQLRILAAPSRRAGRSSRDGFTLIEVLVSFTILALVMVLVQRGVVNAVGGTNRAGVRVEAEMVARTLMTAPLADAAFFGRTLSGQLNGFDWTIRLEQINLPFAINVTTDGKAPAFVPRRMIVVVSERGRGSVVSTETVRLVKAPSS